MFEAGQKYYCKTDKEVDLLMSLLEKENYKWVSGANLRSLYQKSPIVYGISSGQAIHCYYPPNKSDINKSVHVQNVQNKIIAELRR